LRTTLIKCGSEPAREEATTANDFLGKHNAYQQIERKSPAHLSVLLVPSFCKGANTDLPHFGPWSIHP
jgi:hypothetical protein